MSSLCGFEREMRSVSRHPPRLYPGKGARTPPLSRVGSSSHTAHLQASSPKYLLCVDRIYSFTYPPYRFTPSPYYGYRRPVPGPTCSHTCCECGPS